jgi:hypothetical protein
MMLAALLAEFGSNAPAAVMVCAAMTLGLLFYAFYFPGEIAAAPEKSRVTFLRERKEAVYDNLRDLNFEVKAGKLPEADYQQMRAALEEEAAGLLAEIQQIEKADG